MPLGNGVLLIKPRQPDLFFVYFISALLDEPPRVRAMGVPMTDDSSFKDKATNVSWGIFFIVFICSLMILDYEIFIWLKTGKSLYTPFYAVLNWLNIEPFTTVYSIELPGIKKILLWLLGLPLPLISSVLTPVLGELFNSIITPRNK